MEKFESRDTTLEVEPRGRAEITVDDEVLEQLVKANPRVTTRELAVTLSSSHSTIHRHLQAPGKVNVVSIWIPHQLSEANKACRVTIRTSLLLYPHCQEFLSHIITGDEQWALYSTPKLKRLWKNLKEQPLTDLKPNVHQPKVMLSCFWDSKGILLLEFLPHGVTVMATSYSELLRRLTMALHQKRPKRTELYLLHDNARHHVTKLTSSTISELG